MYRKIMVPLDGSELAECVLPHVASIARSGGADNVTLVRVVEPFYMPASGRGPVYDGIRQANAARQAAAEKYLQQLVSRTSYGGAAVQTEVLTGKTADKLADYAVKNGVDLIVIATHGRSGASRWAFGSVADRILRSACVPVLTVRAPGCAPGV